MTVTSETPARRAKARAYRRPLAAVAAEGKIGALGKDTWDGGLRGFGVRVSKGARSWVVMYRLAGKLGRITIGNALVVPYDEARAKAVEILGKAERGEDPRAAAPAVEKVTVKDAFDRYFRQHVDRQLGARTASGLRGLFEKDVLPQLGARPIAELRKADVIQIVDAVLERAPVGANRVHAALRAFLNWCVGKDILQSSPAIGTKPPTAEGDGRERALDADEIRLFWEACGAIGPLFGTPFRLMLATAQRRDEVREMSWSELDLDNLTWTIPAERAKNGREHEVALSDLAVALLESVDRREGLVFPAVRRKPGQGGEVAISGLSRAKRRLDAEMTRLAGRKIERFTLHDLRRTAATQMAELGVAPHVVDKLLNHKSGTIRGVAAIYNRARYRAEQRDALIRWGRRLAAIVGQCDVVDMRARA